MLVKVPAFDPTHRHYRCSIVFADLKLCVAFTLMYQVVMTRITSLNNLCVYICLT